MNVVVVAGTLSSDPLCRQLASGSTLWSLEVTTRADTGTTSVPVVWFDPPSPPTFVAGDAVHVVGEVRRRFFRVAASTQARTEVVATHVVPSGRRVQVRRLLERAGERMGSAEDRGLRSV